MSKTRRPSPWLLGAMLALMITIWSVNFIAAKIALRHVAGLPLVWLRLELAGVVMAVIYFLAPGQRTKFDRRDIGLFFVLGIVGVILNQGGFTYGLKFTSVGHSAILIALSPVIVLLLARLTGLETISRRKAFGIALCFAGAMVLAAESGFGSSFGSETLLGDGITLASVIGYAVWVVTAKKIIAKYDTITICYFNFLTSAVCLLPCPPARNLDRFASKVRLTRVPSRITSSKKSSSRLSPTYQASCPRSPERGRKNQRKP